LAGNIVVHHPTYIKKNEERSTNGIVSNVNLSGDKILFSTFYTDLFLLFGKKNWEARAPTAPPLATALHCIR